MSYTLNLHGHCADEAKMDAILGEVRALAFSLDALTDRDAGDTFGGTFSGPNISVSFPETPAETEPSDEAVAGAADEAASSAEE